MMMMDSQAAPLLKQCERDRDEWMREYRHLRRAVAAFLTAYHHHIGHKEELAQLARVFGSGK